MNELQIVQGAFAVLVGLFFLITPLVLLARIEQNTRKLRETAEAQLMRAEELLWEIQKQNRKGETP
jgi:hypothetical protein